MRRSHWKLYRCGNKTDHKTAPVSIEDHVDGRRCNTEAVHSMSLNNYLLKDDKIRDAETPVRGEDWRDCHHQRPKKFCGNGIFLQSPNDVRMQKHTGLHNTTHLLACKLMCYILYRWHFSTYSPDTFQKTSHKLSVVPNLSRQLGYWGYFRSEILWIHFEKLLFKLFWLNHIVLRGQISVLCWERGRNLGHGLLVTKSENYYKFGSDSIPTRFHVMWCLFLILSQLTSTYRLFFT